MQDFLKEVIQSSLIQYAPTLITAIVVPLVGYLISLLRSHMATSRLLKNVQITKEQEDRITQYVLKTCLAIEEKVVDKATGKSKITGPEKQDMALFTAKVKFPEISAVDLERNIQAVMPDVRAIFDKNNPAMLVK